MHCLLDQHIPFLILANVTQILVRPWIRPQPQLILCLGLPRALYQCEKLQPERRLPRDTPTMTPTRGTAVASGSRTSNSDRPASKAQQQLQAGLRMLQNPCSEAAAEAVRKHLETAHPFSQGTMRLGFVSGKHLQQHGRDASQVLRLLNRYLEWLMPGLPSQPSVPQAATTTTSSSSSSSNSSSSSSSSSRPAGDSYTDIGPSRRSGLVLCLSHILDIVSAAAKTESQQVAAAIRFPLVAPGTGTISLIGRMADSVLLPLPRNKYEMSLFDVVLTTWNMASSLVYPTTDNVLTSSSSGSSSSSTTTIQNLLRQEPHLVQPLLAITGTLHRYLQLPSGLRLGADHDVFYLTTAIGQLQQLLQGAAAAEHASRRVHSSRSDNSSSGSSGTPRQQQQQQQQRFKKGHSQQATPLAAGEQQPSPSSSAIDQLQAKVSFEFPAAAKAQVERFLWHALATATAALDHHAKAQARANAGQIPTTTSTTSSSSSGGGMPSTPRIGRFIPAGAAYDLLLSVESANRISSQAATALLQLATAGLPQQQLVEVATAPGLLEQHDAADVAALLARLGSVFSPKDAAGCRAVISSVCAEKRTPLPPAEYMWWPGSGVSSPCSSSCSGGASSSTGGGASTSTSTSTSTSSSSSSSTSTRTSTGTRSNSSSSSSSSNNSSSSSRVEQETTETMRQGPGNDTPSSHTPGIGTSTTGRPSQTPSTSISAAGGVTDLLGSTDARVQLLAAAVASRWRLSPKSITACTRQAVQTTKAAADEDVLGGRTLTTALLLLGQQLQGASPQLRAAFLHSPAGGTVLQVLTEYYTGELATIYRMDVMRGASSSSAAAQQQQQEVTVKREVCGMSGMAAVPQLLLPGLLLQPAPAEPGGLEGADNVSSSSSRATDSNGSSKSGAAGEGGGSGRSSDADQNHRSHHPASTHPGSSRSAVMHLGAGVWVPFVSGGVGQLQLPPGCTPPPAAFFLVEQLLRKEPSAVTMDLAVQLLKGCAAIVTAGSLQQPQPPSPPSQQQQQQPAAAAELPRVAYLSLARSVVQACMAHRQLGRSVALELLMLASELADVAYAGDAAERAGTSSNAEWVLELAVALAGLLAAGAYTAHSSSVCVQAGPAGAAEPCIHNSSGGGGGSSRGGAAGATGCPPAAGASAGAPTSPGGCRECLLASGVLGVLRSIKSHGALPRARPDLLQALWAQAARALGISLQQYLQVQLLMLSWRCFVPGVCGNVLCRRLEGPSATGAVLGRKGTLCGSCKQAWYCCEGCQRAAWEEHREVCKDMSYGAAAAAC